MIQRLRVPAPPLSDFVAVLWLYDGWTPPHEKERALPDGSVELVVNLLEDETRMYDADDPTRVQRLSGTVVCGPHSRAFVIDTAEQVSAIGVHFRAGGAFPFLAAPADALTDTHVSLEVLWRREASLLRERVLEAETPEEKLDVLEETLQRRLAGAARHPAVAFALSRFRSRPHATAVARVTEEIGLSPRRFIEVFRREVGLTPKLFCRVRRFQRVLASVYRQEAVDWADVAVACGYYDQAHFIHDFRAFSGISPTAYVEKRGRHRNHVAV